MGFVSSYKLRHLRSPQSLLPIRMLNRSKKHLHDRAGIIVSRQCPRWTPFAADIADRNRGPKEAYMRYSTIVMALSVMTTMAPQSSAQTPPANTGAPPASTPPASTQPQQQNNHSRAKGAAAGAAVGAIAGDAGKGAAAGMVVGGMSTRHNHREERRSKR